MAVAMVVIVIVMMLMLVVIVMMTVVLVLGGGRHWRQENGSEQCSDKQAFHESPKMSDWRCDPMSRTALVQGAIGKH